MNYRPLGRTGVNVSEIGLGTWQLGGADWGAVSESDALAILRRSFELGVNFFDTADVYGMGVSERFIGSFLRELGGKASNVYVATKLGRRKPAGIAWTDYLTLDQVREDTKRSLSHLGVDCIFLQQLHCIPTEELRRGEVFEHLRTIQKEGLIRHWGVSVESVEEGLLCMDQPDCATLQVIFNVFRQKVSRELLPVARRKQVGILARVPLASGLLAGRFKPGHRFPPSDHRAYNADGQKFNVGETFAGVPFDKGVELAEKIRAIVPSGQANMAQQALRWILDHDAVSTVIPGATKLSQAESNAGASALPPLPPDVHEKLRDLYDREIAPVIRGKY